MDKIVQAFESYKYKEFKKDDKVFEFLKCAGVNDNDVFEKMEALGFYHGYISNKEMNL